ncbi:hypothetical protein [Marinifilum flexuosum]|uniref:hypothetical protein n=1 Tax=Marinifilum flexuosum TaxID=1117708 RepID=UPI0024917472|nr:hypothetical protein [Marinifilum flexuosum]
MKKITITLFFLVSISLHLFADVTIRIIDATKKIMRVTYTYTDSDAGANTLVFPTDGFPFANSPLKVISVIEKNTEQDLEYQVVERRNGQSVKVYYTSPIPNGGNYTIEITAEAKTDNISVDSQGRFVFTYETGSKAFFVLPQGHAVVYSNYPVLIYERKGSTVCHVRESGRKKLMFKTRAFNQ